MKNKTSLRLRHSTSNILRSALVLALFATAAHAAPPRPAAPLPPLKQIGQIRPRASADGASPRIGIGFEKLDRDVFDPEKAYDKVAAIGVKWVRIQSGWQRTEKTKGRYDFAWLDSIVDNLLKRGMTPWMCLCYGNEIHTPAAAKIFGAVGVPPVKTDEERQAWANYVTATVSHFKGRVPLYEIWNEPDQLNCWKHGVNPAEYGRFAIATAAAIRAADPAAQIAAGAVTNTLKCLPFLAAALDTGMGARIDAFTYHYYDITELGYAHRYESVKALLHSHNPKIKLIQGESGAQSRPDGKGALRHLAWTPRKQAKLLLRHLVTDISLGVEFTSYFSTIDMIEALDGKVGDKASYLDYGYFGVLGADFDADGRSTGDYTPKPAYYALQNLCATFTADVRMAPLPVQIIPGQTPSPHGPETSISSADGAALQYHGLKKTNGACAFVYWNATDILTTDYAATLSFVFSNLPRPVRLVDLMTGAVYEIPDAMLTRDKKSDTCTLHNLRLADYPLMLTFGDFIPFDPKPAPAAIAIDDDLPMRKSGLP